MKVDIKIRINFEKKIRISEFPGDGFKGRM